MLSGLGNSPSIVQRAGARIDLAADRRDTVPRCGIDACRRRGSARARPCAARSLSPRACAPARSAGTPARLTGKIDLDRIELRDRGQLGRRARPGCRSGRWRCPTTPSIGEVTLVQPRFSCACSTAALGRVDRRLVGLVGLHGVVELLLADRAFLGERRVARDVELGLAERRLRLRQLARAPGRAAPGTRAGRSGTAAAPALHDVAFLVVLAQQVALHLRADRRR